MKINAISSGYSMKYRHICIKIENKNNFFSCCD